MPAEAQVHAVAVDPRRPERVYAAGPGGVFRSNDAGRAWEPASQGLDGAGIASLSLDPEQPERVYGATAAGRLFRSDDGGATWQPLAS